MLNLHKPIKLEREQFILFCDRKCEEACVRLCFRLEQRMEEIMQFFKIDKLEKKVRIYVSSKREVFREHVVEIAEQYEGVEYQDWMIADTYDGDINLLSLRACKGSQAHSNMCGDDYDRVIVHEFVHICQGQCFHREVPREKFCGWFWEALATNLAGQLYPLCTLESSAEQLLIEFPNLPNPYGQAFWIGKYMLMHMGQEKVLEYVYEPEKLAEDMEEILDEVRLWLAV